MSQIVAAEGDQIMTDEMLPLCYLLLELEGQQIGTGQTIITVLAAAKPRS